MQAWQHLYDPFNNIYLSALVATIPVIFFFLALTVLRLKGHIAGAITLLLSIAIAIFAFAMPVKMALLSAVHGFIYGLWPIAWIIIGAVFLYKLTVKSGQFDIIRDSIVYITDDKRLQVLLIGFCFGGFLEGAAGFGAPVAITAALLAGLGFNPVYAAGLCLIANTAPVAFGALGIPITVAGSVSGIEANSIGAMTSRQLCLLAAFVPLWIVFIMDGIKGVKETLPATLVTGISFAVVQYITAHYISYQLAGITSALISMLCLTMLLKVWQPKTNQSLQINGGGTASISHSTDEKKPLNYSFQQILLAWSPFIILTIMVSVWTLKTIKDALSVFSLQFIFDGIQIMKAAPVATGAKDDFIKNIFILDIVAATGTAIFIAAIISVFILKVKPKLALCTLWDTLKELKWSIFSIGMVLAFAFVTNNSGMSVTMALVLAGTGIAFPFFSPFLGWLGVFLTGSDTSANALFSSLQANTANQLDLSSTLMVAANSSGGVTGKMISPQSIAVACAATNQVGKESDLFRFTVKHSLFFAVIVGVINLVICYVTPWMIYS
ncbi:L-lactate permease [Entomomonas moraniae]|uniref:L-lactate permease n=1 Tax=Entomomonas moraniae TaxID=2213226 RepID=A0A3Q9JMU5_9GAMM|nr:lactate permease LctP family transporter [Entomomonas moraniae]AZS49920.1 L-lactate permease [Entomomonas moraniae]